MIIDKSSYISKTAVIIGEVSIGRNCGIFPNAVIRGDQNSIKIEDGSNVQDCCIIHTDNEHKVRIGKNVSIGHGAIIHGSIIENDCLIGMNVTILNGVKIGCGSIIGANTLVKNNMIIPKSSLVYGVPGKIIKNDDEFRKIAVLNAETYQKISKEHLEGKYKTYNNTG